MIKDTPMPDDSTVITVTQEHTFGTVVRWYPSLDAARHHGPTLIASRKGIRAARGYLNAIPQEWITAANQVYEQLAAKPDTDLTHLATHEERIADDPVPITPA